MQNLTSFVHNFESKDRSEWDEMQEMMYEVVGELSPHLARMAKHLAEVAVPSEMTAEFFVEVMMTRLGTGVRAALTRV